MQQCNAHRGLTMRDSTLELESTLTDRYQTTVPTAVRQALRLGKRDRIRYRVMDGGQVLLERAQPDEVAGDPALAPFLGLMARDLQRHPERLSAVPAEFAGRLLQLVADAQIDLDAPLDPADD